MIRYVIAGGLAILLAGAASPMPPETAPAAWRITFDDEFTTWNQSHWTTTFADGSRHLGQDESEIYVDPGYTGDTNQPLRLDPFSIKDGALTIRADRVSPEIAAHLEGRKYTSGLSTTRYSFQRLYGYFEIRARMPAGMGLWPAFWLLASDGAWPPEISVVEVDGDYPDQLATTVHWVGANNPHESQGFTTKVPDTSRDFHRYRAFWTANYIAWYFHGQRIAFVPTPPGMRKPMYLLINLAVGGWAGQPDATTGFPADLRVAYVRAFALPDRWADPGTE
jgi:beta-glucanase (GH16 family)